MGPGTTATGAARTLSMRRNGRVWLGMELHAGRKDLGRAVKGKV
jgi:hypothetical protein